MTSILAEPVHYKHSGKVAPNRFLKSAMTERLSTYSGNNPDERGKPTPEYIELYKQWGQGAIGTIILGNIPVDRTHLEAPNNAVIDKRSPWDAVAAFRPAIAAAKAGGSIVIGQLTHGGRQTSNIVNPNPKSSSDIQTPPGMGMVFNKPTPMTIEEIKELIQAFANAAKVLYEAGADGIQLHSAHGYLLSQFLSARVNKRSDAYGGSLENRSRIVFEIIDEIKKNVPKEFILSIKMNSADFSDGGFTEEESRTVAKRLDEAGLDLIELSGGTYESAGFEHKKESTIKREGFFVEFAERIRPELKDAVLAVTGGFRSKGPMEEAIANGTCHVIGIGRPLTAEPFFCKELLEGKISKAKENKVDQSLQIHAAVVQIAAMGSRQPLLDFASQKVADDFLAAVTAERAASQA